MSVIRGVVYPMDREREKRVMDHEFANYMSDLRASLAREEFTKFTIGYDEWKQSWNATALGMPRNRDWKRWFRSDYKDNWRDLWRKTEDSRALRKYRERGHG